MPLGLSLFPGTAWPSTLRGHRSFEFRQRCMAMKWKRDQLLGQDKINRHHFGRYGCLIGPSTVVFCDTTSSSSLHACAAGRSKLLPCRGLCDARFLFTSKLISYVVAYRKQAPIKLVGEVMPWLLPREEPAPVPQSPLLSVLQPS